MSCTKSSCNSDQIQMNKLKSTNLSSETKTDHIIWTAKVFKFCSVQDNLQMDKSILANTFKIRSFF